MEILVLGPGCTKCKQLLANVNQAVSLSGVDATVRKVEELREIMKYNVMVTPGLVIDGKVKSSGKLLPPGEIVQMIRAAGQGQADNDQLAGR